MQQNDNASPKSETFPVSTSFGACRYERCFLDAKGWHYVCCCPLTAIEKTTIQYQTIEIELWQKKYIPQ